MAVPLLLSAAGAVSSGVSVSSTATACGGSADSGRGAASGSADSTTGAVEKEKTKHRVTHRIVIPAGA